MSKHALILVQDSAISAPSGALFTLQQTAIEQMRLIRRYQNESAIRSILVGLSLWRIKASMKGTFTEWLKKDFDGVGYRQARYYMSASLAFLEKTKATKPEFLALPGDQTQLTLDSYEGAARSFMEKITEFVGERSLGELLADLGLKETAKKKATRVGEDRDDEGSTDGSSAELSVQDRFNELSEALRNVRQGTADKALWMSFTKQQHADLKAAADATAEHVTTLFVKTHGRKDR